MTPPETDESDAIEDGPDEPTGTEKLDEIEDKVAEGREALTEHEPDEDEHQFIQDGSIRTDLIDDAIRPAS